MRTVTAGSSLREKQRHRASLLVGENNHAKDLSDPKNLVASIIQKQKRASELASSKPSSSSSSIDKEKKNAYEIAKIDADVALHQQRINEEKRKIAEKLSSRFRSSSSTTTSAATTTTTTNSNNNTTKSKREPRSTYWRISFSLYHSNVNSRTSTSNTNEHQHQNRYTKLETRSIALQAIWSTGCRMLLLLRQNEIECCARTK